MKHTEDKAIFLDAGDPMCQAAIPKAYRTGDSRIRLSRGEATMFINDEKWRQQRLKDGEVGNVFVTLPIQWYSQFHLMELRDARHVMGKPDLDAREAAYVLQQNQLVFRVTRLIRTCQAHNIDFHMVHPLRSWWWQFLDVVETMQTRRNFLEETPYICDQAKLEGALPCWHNEETSVVDAAILADVWLSKLAEERRCRQHTTNTRAPSGELPSELLWGRQMVKWYQADLEPELPADLQQPFVADGMGAAKGLSPMEHARWALMVEHPYANIDPEVDEDPRDTIDFVMNHSAKEVYHHRRIVLRWLMKVAGDLQGDRPAWLRHAPSHLHTLLEPLHGPLFLWAMRILEWKDVELAEDLYGFPLVGLLPKAYYSSRANTKVQTVVHADVVRENRAQQNAHVLQHLKELPHSEDIMEDVLTDVGIGAMTPQR